MTHQFYINFDGEKDCLEVPALQESKFFRAASLLCFLYPLKLQCKWPGYTVQQTNIKNPRGNSDTQIFFFSTLLYLLSKQITWHFCSIFYSELSQCIAVVNKSNLSSSTNGKLRGRSWIFGSQWKFVAEPEI